MSKILDFYQDKGLGAGRTFHQVLALSDHELEANCDWVQWVFPLPEPSKMQPDSPVAVQSDYDAIATTPHLKMRVLASLGRYIAFLDRTTQWRRAKDHNHMRITRVIRCLCLCGLNDPAYDFYEYVKETVGSVVSKETILVLGGGPEAAPGLAEVGDTNMPFGNLNLKMREALTPLIKGRVIL